MLAWPSASWISSGGAPFSRRRDANEWRKTWGATGRPTMVLTLPENLQGAVLLRDRQVLRNPARLLQGVGVLYRTRASGAGAIFRRPARRATLGVLTLPVLQVRGVGSGSGAFAALAEPSSRNSSEENSLPHVVITFSPSGMRH